MQYLTGSFWDKGFREVNQDSATLICARIEKKDVLFLVCCDGIGGLTKGEEISGYCATELSKWFYGEGALLIKRRSYKGMISSLYRCFYHMWEYVKKWGKQQGIKMGTTCTVVLLIGRKYYIFHVGDCRVYLLGKRGKILTVDDGVGNALTKCIGTFAYYKPTMYQGVLWGREGLLVCTDGYRRCISIKQLLELLNPATIKTSDQLEKHLKRGGEYVKKQGETDNMTALCVMSVR